MEEIKELYELYSKGIYSYLFYLTKDQQQAEELMQETFYQACLSIHRFNQESKVSTWLYQIAKHLFYKSVQKKKSILPIDSTSHHPDQDTPERKLIEKENDKELMEAVHLLEAPYQQVVLLRIFHEMSFKEIGEELGKSENWARVTFYRSKQQLQKSFREKGYRE